jgi:glutathione S-transferase
MMALTPIRRRRAGEGEGHVAVALATSTPASQRPAMITLHGSTTSPFVRRVRVVCIEKALPFTLVNTATEDGQRALDAVSPIGKVPVARLDDGRVVFDSRVILDELCRPGAGDGSRTGWEPLRAPFVDARARVDEENATNLVDEALLALVRLFYLRRDGVDLAAAYLQKEQRRAATILRHLDDQVIGHHLTRRAAEEGGLGRPELALVTALDWMQFRGTFDLTTVPRLNAALQWWLGQRASLAQTRPG